MPLSRRTRNFLSAAGINTADQVRALLDRNQPGVIPGIGKKSLAEVRSWLQNTPKNTPLETNL